MSRGPARLNPAAVVAAAAALADEVGLEALSLAGLAERLGVRPPSLYTHVGGLADLRGRLALTGVTELTGVLQRATVGRAGADALRSLATSYRGWAHRHPGRYAATLAAPDPADRELAAAAEELLGLLLAVLAGLGLRGDDALHAARAVRSALHGFVALEAAGGFKLGLDADESYARLVDALVVGLGRAP